MPKQTILMDVDGVLLDLITPVQEYSYSKYNTPIYEEMFTSWDWDYALGIPLICDELWEHIWSSDLQPYRGAISFVKTLQDLNFTVVAVSCRSTKEAKANAERQFPVFKFAQVILCDNYKEKIQHARDIDATWSLEDNPKTAAALGRSKSDLHSCLLERPWNRDSIALTEDYKRILSYNEFIGEYIDSLWK